MSISIQKQLDEAEGYLMLSLPGHALQILERRLEWGKFQFEACLLQGEALRSLDRYREALAPLEKAAILRPEDPHVALALGWCYKRTNRLAQAIDAIERARRSNPDEPLLRYNLACYWSLAGNAMKALEELSIALRMDPELRSQLSMESDFDQIRNLPQFIRLSASSA